MKLILVFLTVCYMNLISCQSQESKSQSSKHIKIENNTNINNRDMNLIIEEQLTKQLLAGYLMEEKGLDGISEYVYTNEDYKAINSISKEILNKNGYKFNDIKDKANLIFGINSDETLKTILVEWACPQDKPLYQLSFEGIISVINPIQLDFESNYLLESIFIPQLLNYQKQYSEISKLEDTLKINFGGLKKIRWKDFPNLDQHRKFNEQLLINRNLYLFNDDKSRLPWLLKNDSHFMKSLVLTFGWTEDEKLLKWVIENNKFDKNNPLEFGKMFYTKRCDGTLKLHSNTFKYLQKTVAPENQEILRDIKLFVQYFADSQNQIEGITEIERLEILSNIVYFAEQYKYEKGFDNRRIMAWMYFFVGQRKSEELLKQNNYFNLPKFKQWWDGMYTGKDFNDVTDINDGMLDDYDP